MKKKYKSLALVLCLSFVICSMLTPFAIKYANIRKGNKKLNGDYVAGELGNNNISYIVDNNTMDSYKDYLINDKTGSKNAGKIWSDKTVLSSPSLTLDEETDGVSGTITNDSDFLHVYSALGSSKNLKYSEIKPLDVVILLDISTSMMKEDTYSEEKGNLDESPAYIVIKEANKMISKLMRDDGDILIHENNRVGIIVYGGGTQVVLPLDHYQKNNGEDYLKIVTTKVDANAKNWPIVTSNVVNSKGEVYTSTSEPMYADSTYLQGAIYQGMNMLATTDDTTYTDKWSKIDRIPILITLTDGATNTSGVSSADETETKIDWWNPNGWSSNQDKVILPSRSDKPAVWSHYVPDPNGNPFYTPINFDSKSAISPRTASVLLTAGFMKNKVEQHYNQNRVGEDEIILQGYGIGINVDNLTNSFEKYQLNGTMNPKAFVKKYADDEDVSTYYKEPYDIIMDYVSGNSPEQEITGVWSGSPLHASIKFDHPSGKDAQYDVKSIDDVYYVDKYMTGNTEDINSIFEQILKQITLVPLKPIEGTNEVGIKDNLTYMDPIGEYMEVKDIKNVSLLGKLYNVTKDKLKYYVVNADKSISEYDVKPDKYDYTRQYYKIVPQDGDVQNNLSYKTVEEDGTINYNVTFKLSEITMYVEKDNDEKEILYVNIPRNALPLQVSEITIDRRERVILYVDNTKQYDASTPLRVFYTVGRKEAIGSGDIINLSQLSKEYIEKNTSVVDSKKYVSLYSNYFSNRKNNNVVYGDAITTFSPSPGNSYYTSVNPLILYEPNEEDNNKEIDLDSIAYKKFISSHKTINTITNENSNKYYYIIIEYYKPNSEQIYHAALLKQGKEFGTGIGGKNISFGEYLCWYSPSANIWKNFSTTKPEDTHTDWVIATKPGGLIVGNMQDELVTKENNNTKTASAYILPTISESTTGFNDGNNIVINMYQGNNGKLQVLENDLTIKKFVSGDLGNASTEWTIKVTLVAPNSQTLNTSYQTIKEDGTKGILSLTNNGNKYEGTIKIKDKETITIKDLPNGVQYKLEEVEANQDDYKTTTKGNLEGTLTGENPTIEFYNKKYSYYDLTIEKVVKGDTKTDQKFTFEIRLVENPDVLLEENIYYKGTNIEDGEIKFKRDDDILIGSFSLMSNQKITLYLPYGTTYEIKEIEENKNGYQTSYKNEQGTIDSDVVVTVTNEKISNPFTIDNIVNYLITFVIGLVSLISVSFIYKKRIFMKKRTN